MQDMEVRRGFCLSTDHHQANAEWYEMRENTAQSVTVDVRIRMKNNAKEVSGRTTAEDSHGGGGRTTANRQGGWGKKPQGWAAPAREMDDPHYRMFQRP